jgi:hypothetical protein
MTKIVFTSVVASSPPPQLVIVNSHEASFMTTVTGNRSLKRELDLTEIKNSTYFVIYSAFFGGVVVAESDGAMCMYKYVTNFVNVSIIKL